MKDRTTSVNQAFIRVFDNCAPSASNGSRAQNDVESGIPTVESREFATDNDDRELSASSHDLDYEGRFVPAPQLQYLHQAEHLLVPVRPQEQSIPTEITTAPHAAADASPSQYRLDSAHTSQSLSNRPHVGYVDRSISTTVSGAEGLGEFLVADVSTGIDEIREERSHSLSSPEQSAATVPPDHHFRPEWEVDSFGTVETSGRLIANPDDLFLDAAQQILNAASSGVKVIGITSCDRGEGRTTLTRGLAQRLACDDVSVAVVDADFERPHLAAHFDVNPAAGWTDNLPQTTEPSEVAIVSLKDRLTLIPLRSPVSQNDIPAAQIVLQEVLNTLADRFDVVLVDLGPAPSGTVGFISGRDGNRTRAMVIVQHLKNTSEHRLGELLHTVSSSGTTVLGTAENFVENS